MITHCPACGTLLEKVEAMHYCKNPKCRARHVESLIHFVSKVAMDIKGLGEKIIEDLYQVGLVQTIPDLYRLHLKKQALLAMEGYSDKSVDQMVASIEASKQRSLEKLLVGLGIKEVGEKTAKQLAKRFLSMQHLAHASAQDLLAMDDTGPVVTDAILAFFKDKENQIMIEDLQSLGLNFNYLGVMANQATFFTDKTVVITGTFKDFSREALTEKLESMGAKVTSSVSKHTHYLIHGQDAGSKLVKAQSLAVSILDEVGLLAILTKEKV
jgi:DNA ligase (NAD+)